MYRAVYLRTRRVVACKVMNPDLCANPYYRARFARGACLIDHLNVIPTYDLGESNGRLFQTMKLVAGTDLATELRPGPLPVPRVLGLLAELTAALVAIHQRALLHLDLKPANVLVDGAEDDHVYLADFGLREAENGARAGNRDFVGTPSYASPEQLRGQPVGPASDVYSLACLLFTALAGRAPYVGDLRTVIITGHLTGVVPSLSDLTGLPVAVDQVIGQGMAARPEARLSCPSELLAQASRALL